MYRPESRTCCAYIRDHVGLEAETFRAPYHRDKLIIDITVVETKLVNELNTNIVFFRRVA